VVCAARHTVATSAQNTESEHGELTGALIGRPKAQYKGATTVRTREIASPDSRRAGCQPDPPAPPQTLPAQARAPLITCCHSRESTNLQSRCLAGSVRYSACTCDSRLKLSPNAEALRFRRKRPARRQNLQQKPCQIAAKPCKYAHSHTSLLGWALRPPPRRQVGHSTKRCVASTSTHHEVSGRQPTIPDMRTAVWSLESSLVAWYARTAIDSTPALSWRSVRGRCMMQVRASTGARRWRHIGR
jgi:hypothetical protein